MSQLYGFPDFNVNLGLENVELDWVNDSDLLGDVEKLEKQQQSERFVPLNDQELNLIITSAEAKGTKRNTKWIVHTIEDWCRDRRLPHSLLEMDEANLDNVLRRFYAEARTKKGEEYSRSSLLGIRNSVERHLTAHDKPIKIAKNPNFQRSNKMLECKLKLNRRLGKENVQHKPVIEAEDMEKMRTSPFMSFCNPSGLLRRVWFIVTLYWCRRGCEGQRQLRRDSFEFLKDAEGHDYAIMTHEEQSKNHQGGMADKTSHEKQTRLCTTGEVGDSFWCLQHYVSKLNPDQPAFFQRPNPNATESQQVWYENKPLGINTLEKMMKEISIGVGLSRKYTNHSVRATAITIWSNAEVPARHIMSISGHVNEQSIASYNSRPSTQQLKRCSNILSTALAGPASLTSQTTATCTATIPASSSTTTVNSSSLQLTSSNAMSFPSGIFKNCHIANANFYIQR